MNKIEQVARAIAMVDYDGEDVWDELIEGLKGCYISNARAAIEAMRVPTEGMVEAAFAADGSNIPLAIGYDEAYSAMIDAALEGK